MICELKLGVLIGKINF